MKRLLVLSLLIVMATFFTQACSNGESKSSKEQQNSSAAKQNSSKAPGFSLTDADGNVVKLSDYEGKVVVLDFWATWCGPCRMEIPGFVKLREKYHEKGVEIIGVSLDQQGWSVVKPFMEQFSINYPIVLGNRQIVMSYGGINAIPTTFIINKQGEVVDKVVGYKPESYFENAINKWLNS